MSRRTARLGFLALGLAALTASLAGCGKLGDLERPGPMFGHAPAAQAAQPRSHQDPNRPVQTIDPRDENGATATPREQESPQ